MTEFKVGDKVKAIRNCSGVLKGKIYIVEKCDFDFGLMIKNNNKGCGCSCEGWELVSTKDSKFKVGDKVVRNDVVRKPYDYSITNKDGGVMGVISIDCDTIKLSTSDGEHIVESKYFNLVEENTESKGGKKMTEFKIGDRVTLKDDYEFKHQQKGKFGTIIEKDPDGTGSDWCRVKWEDDSRNNYQECGMVLITEQKNKMTDIKKFDKKALSEAVKDIDEERLDKQKEDAKDILRGIYSKKDIAEESKEKVSEELKDIDKELNAFTKASK